MAKPDYYETLGVSRDADLEEIKASYRRLARQYHPDVNPESSEAEEQFKEINEAYEILSDPQKRAAYDRFGHTGLGGGMPPTGDPFEAVNDLFNMFFGGATATATRGFVHGDDLRFDMEIDLEDVLKGVSHEVTITKLDLCDACKGAGAELGTEVQFCPDCSGTGRIRHTKSTILGSVTQVVPCARCKGEGEIIETPCGVCRGQRRTRKTMPFTVQVPPGVEDGTILSYKDQGDAGLRGGDNGDLHIVVHVKPHSRFARRGTELVTQLNLTFPQLALGDEVEIETLDGKHPVEVPAGTQPNEEVVVKGLGLPRVGGGTRGNLHVRIGMKVPKKLNETQRDLLKQFAEASGIHFNKSSPDEPKSFFGQLKKGLGGQ
jgi:molecular chaperone DnaJ